MNRQSRGQTGCRVISDDWQHAIMAWAVEFSSSHYPGSLRLRLFQLRQFAEDHPDPWAVSPADLLTWLEDLAARHRSGRAVSGSYARTLQNFYTWAKSTGLNHTNPARRVSVFGPLAEGLTGVA